MSLFPDAEDWQLLAGHQEWSGLAYGAADGSPVLMLHGWLDNAGSMVPLARGLQPRRIWLPDLPGHGRSGHRPPGMYYHFIDYVCDVLMLADALGLDQFDLVGHSMGGAISTLLAAAFPERVRRLVLIEGMGPLSRPAESTVADLRRGLAARVRLPDKQLKVHADRTSARAARMAAGGLSAEAADMLVERALMPAAGGYVWRSDPRQTLPTPMRGTEEQYLAVLAGITAPTLVILADPPMAYIDASQAERRLAAMPAAQVIRLPGSHHLHLENPEPVIAAIAAFLDQQSPSTAPATS